jgi:hypothetical protein
MSINFDQVADQATKYAKDGVYLTVGLVAVAAEKLREQWADATKQLESGLGRGNGQFSAFTSTARDQLQAVEARWSDLESRIVELVDGHGDRLPEAAKSAVGKAIETGRSARAQWLALVLPKDAARAA